MAQTDKYKNTFKDEAYELLAELETSLLELEESPGNKELVGRVFRAMHTIKGSGAMFGFDDISQFVHEIETVFDLVRNGKIPVTRKLVDSTLLARDHIRSMLDSCDRGAPADEAKTKSILSVFHEILSMGGKQNSEKTNALHQQVAQAQGGNATVYRIQFRPATTIFMNGTNPLLLLKELQALGDARIVAYTDKIPLLDEINPEFCYTSWDIVLTTQREVNVIQDVFIFVADSSEVDIRTIDTAVITEGSEEQKKLGEILVERGVISKDTIQQALSSRKHLGEILSESGVVTDEGIQSALFEQSMVREVIKKRQSTETSANIRVPAVKLDHFVNLVGELVITQQRLSQLASLQNNSELLSVSEAVDRLTTELRDSAFSIRMVPIETTFNKLKRLVRDLSGELKREAEMTTSGGDTELDKTVIDQLNDPLVHIIRNCIDHGIEKPDARVAAGKPRKGTIHLSAAHSGPHVMIQIKDDGKGMDPVAIKSKAVEKGIIASNAELSEKECIELIFAPGFSTAKEITSVSGRGVGMDVVRRTIDMLRGSIDINTKHGAGTTITITLPLTLAIIEGLQVVIGGERFVLPLSAIEECIELTREDTAKSNGKHLANVRGEMVPYIRLKEWFLFPATPTNGEQIAIARIGNQRVGFVVDHVIGKLQTVIKTLGKIYKNTQGISGATILGDGQIALIVDIVQILHKVEQSNNHSI